MRCEGCGWAIRVMDWWKLDVRRNCSRALNGDQLSIEINEISTNTPCGGKDWGNCSQVLNTNDLAQNLFKRIQPEILVFIFLICVVFLQVSFSIGVW